MWEAICTSSILILVVLALRLVFSRSLSRRVQYGLWAVVALRLLLPFPLLPSNVSVMNAVEAAETVIRTELPLPAFSGEGVEPNPELETVLPPPLEQVTGSVSLARLGGLLWMGGALAVGGWMAFSNLRFSRRLKKTAAPVEQEGFPLPVYLARGLSSPCLSGVLRPAVYLTPESLESPKRIRHILTHEYTHYRHGDHIFSLVRCICLAVYWFHPLVWVAAVVSRQDCELACDEGALRQLGEEERISYGRTLLELVSGSGRSALWSSTTMTSAGRALKRRMVRIVKNPRETLLALCAVILVSLCAVGCTFTGAASGPVEQMQEPLGESSLSETIPEVKPSPVSVVPSLSGAQMEERMWAVYGKNDCLALEQARDGEVLWSGLEGDVSYSQWFGNVMAGYGWNGLEQGAPAQGDSIKIASGDGTRGFAFYEKEGRVLYWENGQDSWYQAQQESATQSVFAAVRQELLHNYWPGIIRVDGRLTEFEEVADAYLEQRARIALAQPEGSIYQAVDFRVRSREILEGNDEIFSFELLYAIKPKDPAQFPLAGNGKEGEGEYEGYFLWNTQILLEKRGESWHWVNEGLGGDILAQYLSQ